MSVEAESAAAPTADSHDLSHVVPGMARMNIDGGPSGEDMPQRTEEEYAAEALTMRAIVSSKEAGVIIGKEGRNVADLREQTQVRAGVSKVVQGVHDRVLTITGPLDNVTRAYGKVAQSLLDGAPQMGMGGLINSNGTHRKSLLDTPAFDTKANFVRSTPSPDLPQPDGHHHRPSGCEDQANSRSLPRSNGRPEGDAATIH